VKIAVEECPLKSTQHSGDQESARGDADGLPVILFIPDVARVTQVAQSAARKAVLRGRYGAHLRLGRRLAVLRSTFLKALQRQEVAPR
jgi:hypothetical protein